MIRLIACVIGGALVAGTPGSLFGAQHRISALVGPVGKTGR
jgi:hypothetical protein